MAPIIVTGVHFPGVLPLASTPRGAHPWRGTEPSLKPDSSTKTRRLRHSVCCVVTNAARFSMTSGRSCSVATGVFFCVSNRSPASPPTSLTTPREPRSVRTKLRCGRSGAHRDWSPRVCATNRVRHDVDCFRRWAVPAHHPCGAATPESDSPSRAQYQTARRSAHTCPRDHACRHQQSVGEVRPKSCGRVDQF